MSNHIVVSRHLCADDASMRAIRSILAPTGDHVLRRSDIDNYVVWESHRANEPLQGPRIFAGDEVLVAFSGDLIDHAEVPFRLLVEACRAGSYGALRDLNGVWAATIIDQRTGEVTGITDRRAQKGLYIHAVADDLVIGTVQPALAMVSGRAEFDPRWLHQLLLFNFPVTEVSILKQVERLAPAEVRTVSPPNRASRRTRYCPGFHESNAAPAATNELDHAFEIFRDRIPRYFGSNRPAACAITGGWDARTILALAPDPTQVTTYTYGIAGSNDLQQAGALTKALGLRHDPIHFDPAFTNVLPMLMLETVHASGAEQGVLRSSLLHVYRHLQERHKPDLTLSGIAMDMLFRGHANTPALVSPVLAEIFRGGSPKACSLDGFAGLLDGDTQQLGRELEHAAGVLEQALGNLHDTRHHLGYIVYPLSARYFGGEVAIAGSFTTLRVPSWDNAIVELAYGIGRSTLRFSQFRPGHKRGAREEMELQSHILKRGNRRFFGRPVQGIYPASVLGGDITYRFNKLAHAGIKRIAAKVRPRAFAALEDWPAWIFDENAEFVASLLLDSSTRLTGHVASKGIRKAVHDRDTLLVGKLLTAEITMRLVANRWRPFW